MNNEGILSSKHVFDLLIHDLINPLTAKTQLHRKDFSIWQKMGE